MQEGQPYQIINCGNISFVSSFNTIFQCGRVLEAKLARAADGVDLDPEPVHGIDNSRFPDFRRVADPDALAGLGHPFFTAICAAGLRWLRLRVNLGLVVDGSNRLRDRASANGLVRPFKLRIKASCSSRQGAVVYETATFAPIQQKPH